LTWEELLEKNENNRQRAEEDVQNCMKLNAASKYFDGGLVQMEKTGTFHYMSSRNNNFSNRSQKVCLLLHCHTSQALTIFAIKGCHQG